MKQFQIPMDMGDFGTNEVTVMYRMRFDMPEIESVVWAGQDLIQYVTQPYEDVLIDEALANEAECREALREAHFDEIRERRAA